MVQLTSTSFQTTANATMIPNIVFGLTDHTPFISKFKTKSSLNCITFSIAHDINKHILQVRLAKNYNNTTKTAFLEFYRVAFMTRIYYSNFNRIEFQAQQRAHENAQRHRQLSSRYVES
jgi:hypothetical protein